MFDRLIAGLIIVAFIFVPLERLFTLRKNQRLFRKQWFNDLIHFFVNHFLVLIGSTASIILAAIILNRTVVNNEFQASVAAQPAWLQFLEAVILADISHYIVHRLQHSIGFLWKFHSVHHSIEEMDWLASVRLHPVDQIIGRTLTIIPLYLMGFTAGTLGVYLSLVTLQALFVHANVNFKFKRLRWLIATPIHHHWHHSNEKAAINKNFGGQFPVIDLLLGTLYMPSDRMPSRYGTDEPVPSSYLQQLKYPFERRV